MTTPATAQHFCSNCGAGLQYAPGTTSMRCPYCGSVETISSPLAPATLKHPWDGSPPAARVAELPPFEFRCAGCGATSSTTDVAGPCPYCTAPAVHDDDLGRRLHRPDAVVPVQLDRRQATEAFQQWVRSRWFAPGALKKVAATETLRGTYVPHWTYDADTLSRYTGQRGEYYYVTVPYTTTENGQTVTRTRQERRTAWYPASGTVQRAFVDVLTTASRALPVPQLAKLEPWALPSAQSYLPEFLTGFQAYRYDLDVDTGFDDARQQMATVIEQDVRYDIGGDEQRVHDVDTRYSDVAYRLVLLPLWLATYLYAGTTFNVMVNASTGEVVGERPYSTVKIVLAVLAGLLLAAAIAAAYYYGKR